MDIYVDFSGKAALTAYATGGQANALLLDSNINWVDIVATTGDSCKLDAALPVTAGSTVKIREVVNLGANDMDLYPATGEQFQEGASLIGVNAAISIAAGNGRKFICFTAGIWRTY